MDEIVILNDYQIGFADGVAYARRMLAIHKARAPRNGSPTDRKKALGRDVLGVRGEAAGHVYTGLRWNALSQIIGRLPDLGDWIDVKGRSKAHYDLPVPKDGMLDWAYMLVDCSGHPAYRIVGWMFGSDAKQAQWWGDPSGEGPAYFVPQKELREPAELLRIIDQKKIAS
jgi:hypothetical protein